MAKSAELEIRQLGTERLAVPIVGISPLIMHRWSEKARLELAGGTKEKRPDVKDTPEQEYEAAFHRLKDGRPGMPAIAFKAATVASARVFGKSVPMTMLRQAVFFHGEAGQDNQMLVPIVGEPYLREDVVRVGNGKASPRYRPCFPEWSATLEIVYIQSLLSRSSVVSLIEAGGMTCGVGEWRPQRNGDMGQYVIDQTRDIEVLSGGDQ